VRLLIGNLTNEDARAACLDVATVLGVVSRCSDDTNNERLLQLRMFVCIASQETTIHGTSLISSAASRPLLVRRTQTKLSARDRRSPAAPATSINLKYLMHANDWRDNLITVFIDTERCSLDPSTSDRVCFYRHFPLCTVRRLVYIRTS